MADDDILGLYYGDRDQQPIGPAGDPNSLSYALRGPSAPIGTSDVLRTMASQQATREREPYEALTRLFMTAAAPLASAPAGAFGANALRRVTKEPIDAYHGAHAAYEGGRYNPNMSQYSAFYAGLEPETANAFARSHLPNSRVYPVKIDANRANLFDYRDPEHLAQITQHIDQNPYFPSGSLAGPQAKRDWAAKGDAGFYELGDVQRWLKDNRYGGWHFQEADKPAIGLTKRGTVKTMSGDTLFANPAPVSGVLAQYYGNDDNK